MVWGRAKLRESKLGAELTWDARQSTSLEAKVLREQVTDRPEVFFSKWIKIKSRRFDYLRCQTIIRNKPGFYYQEET